MDNLNYEKYYETLLNNFAKKHQYNSYLKIKNKKKRVSWNETNLIKFYYYSNDK